MATATETVRGPALGRAATWHPSATGWTARIAVFVAIFGGALLITANVQPFWADRIAHAGVYALIGLSLNIVLGYVGQVSLGHQGFVGIAAFVAAFWATEKAQCPTEACSVSGFVTALALAALTGAVAAGLLGLVALRIRGLYLALITLAYGLMAENSIFEIPGLTRGGAGMPAPRPRGFTGDHAFMYLVFAFLALVLFIDWSLLRSKVGRAILSVKHSEPVAASYGINVTAYKIIAFVTSGVFAGVAGALFAFRRTTVVAADFSFEVALLWVLMVVVGGLGNRTGVVIGSAFFALFPFLIAAAADAIGIEVGGVHLEDWLNEIGRPLDFFTIAFGGVLALLTITLYPGGIGEQISPITRWLRGEKFSMHPDGHHGRKKHDEQPVESRIAREGLRPGFLAMLGLSQNSATEAVPSAATAEHAPTESIPVAAGRDADAAWRRPEQTPREGDGPVRDEQPTSVMSSGFLSRMGLGAKDKRDGGES